MRFFKISQYDREEYPVNRENFDLARSRNKMLFQGESCYGICPYCDSPVQLIGIFRKTENVPYGKHCGKDVPDVGTHNQEVFEYCPYRADRKKAGKEDRIFHISERERNLYRLLRNHFDQVIYLLKQDTGLYFSKRTAEEMLKTAHERRIWLYPEADEANLPWMFAYLSDPIGLYGRYVRIGSNLYIFLKERGVSLEACSMDGYERVGKRGAFFSWYYFFGYHERKVVDGKLLEYLRPQVMIHQDIINNHSIWEEKIKIDHQRFFRLAHSEKAGGFRNRELLEIAARVLPEI